ncbi:hypothetical protein ABZW18_05805 [Streptomyces sp. NPDC004647]|uniref:hypothetical protein n=1 Tax=Streptomyces sp. NPDC004647 TaxID=3154671 RepID=UPI0033A403E3
MTTLTHQWLPRRIPDDTDVRRIYGFCFDAVGRVLLGVEGSGEGSEEHHMPGGAPEPEGYDFLATLVSKCRREFRVSIDRPVYLGYRKVRDEAARLTYAELFLAARITTFHRQGPDSGSCRRLRRLLTPVDFAPDRLGWGSAGLQEAAAAAAVATNALGLDLSIPQDEVYRN